jgi:tetratricopeptide (TPR) repeat protein
MRMGERRDDPVHGFAHLWPAAAFVLAARGQEDAAEQLLAVIARLERRRGPSDRLGPWVAAVLDRLGRAEEARARIEHTQGLDDRTFVWKTLAVECDLVADQGRWDEAPAAWTRARAVATTGGLLAAPLSADRLEGRTALAAGRPEEAVALLARAARGFSELEAEWERAATELHLAEAHLARGDPDAARAHLAEAAPVIERLGPRRELAAVQALAVRL